MIVSDYNGEDTLLDPMTEISLWVTVAAEGHSHVICTRNPIRMILVLDNEGGAPTPTPPVGQRVGSCPTTCVLKYLTSPPLALSTCYRSLTYLCTISYTD